MKYFIWQNLNDVLPVHNNLIKKGDFSIPFRLQDHNKCFLGSKG